MPDKNLAPVCGLYCGTCEYLGSRCPGCVAAMGKPFWTAMMEIDVCPLHDCCASRKQLEHCGLCDEFPCKIFLELSDPAMTDKEAEESLLARKNTLRRRKEVGTEKWLGEII